MAIRVRHSTAVGGLLILTLGFTGCASESTPSLPATGEKSTHASEETYGPDSGFVLVEGSVPKEDAHGKYATIELPKYPESDTDSPTSYDLVTPAKKFAERPDMQEAGWTQDDVGLALERSYGLIYEGVMDGERLDTPTSTSEYSSWVNDSFDAKYGIYPTFRSDFADPQHNFFITGRHEDGTGYMPLMVRDGGRRWATTLDADGGSNLTRNAEVTMVSARLEAEGYYVDAYFSIEFNYRFTDESMIAYQMRSEQASEEEVLKDLPELADGEGENLLSTAGTLQYTFFKDPSTEDLSITATTIQLETNVV
jgi:hypothetical protein